MKCIFVILSKAKNYSLDNLFINITMKKNLITLILSVVTTTCFAQAINWGAKAGVNFSKMVLNNPDFVVNSRNTTGYNLGAILDIGYNNFSIQPGLFVTTKGERISSALVDVNNNSAGTSNSRYTLTYLELPINLLYRANLVNGLEIHAGGGPYFAYGVSAKSVVDGVAYPAAFGDHAADADYAGIYYKNPDYGINFIAGAVFQKQYILDLQYSLGLGNLSYSPTATLRNRVMSVSVGYMFR